MSAESPSNVVRVNPLQPEPEVMQRAGEILRAGGLVAFPTETVYGLGANALDEAAVARIFRVKGRPAHDPLIVHIASPAQLDQIAAEVPPVARILAEHFWPGPLTLVLPKHPEVPDSVTAGLPTVGVRMPSHPVAVALLRAAGVPVAAPSANPFSRTSATTAQHVAEDFSEQIDLIIDGGPAHHGIESTVLAVSPGELRLLRPGAVPLEAIRALVERLPEAPEIAVGAAHRSASPGQEQKHYAPRARMLLYSGPEETVRKALREQTSTALSAGQRVGLLLPREDLAALGADTSEVVVEDLGPAADLDGIAHRLYAALRRLDAAQVDLILARSLGQTGLARAIHDRLTRAASGNVIEVP